MKRNVFLLVSLLCLAPLSSCGKVGGNDEILHNTYVEIFTNSDKVSVEIKDEKETYSKGDVVSLECVFEDGYSLAYVTLNNEKVEDPSNIVLVEGSNVIYVYAKSTDSNEGSTNIRDFTFQESGDKASYVITGYIPTGIYPTTLNIPSAYLNKPVTGLSFLTNDSGNVSQYSFSGIENISIPSSIKTIDTQVFRSNDTIKSFIVDENNAKFSSFEGNLYNKDQSEFLVFAQSSASSLTIPDSVTSIASYAFYGANNLETVKFNSTSSLKKIGESAFEGAKNMVEIYLPNSVETIGDSVFKTCLALEKVSLGSSLNEISTQCFYQCGNLDNVEIPSSVKKIGQYALSDCDSLKTVTFNEGLEEIVSGAFSLSALTKVSFPSTLKKIGSIAFQKNYYLTEVTFSEGLEEIDKNAFNTCTMMEINGELPKSLTTIGEGAFEACLSISSFEVNSENNYFASKDGVLFNKNFTTLIYYPNSKSDKSYVVPSTVTTLGKRSFAYISSNPSEESDAYYSLETLTIPKSVKYIHNAFYGGKLKQIIYLGTESEFSSITSNYVDSDGVSYDWNSGSSIEEIVYSEE